jgi:hypothetical protein
MNTFQSLPGLLLTASITFFALSASATNVVGTWVGVANVAVIGANPHHNTKAPQEVRFAKTEFTFVIDKQQGQNFSGYRFSKNGFKDSFVGAFRSNMKSGVISDSDGTRAFEMVGNDTMDSCYTHTVAANGSSTVAECNELKRQ